MIYVAVDCGPLPAPANGVVATIPDTMLNAVAMYGCNQGFALTGSTEERVCQPSGMWSGVQPECQSKLYQVYN